MKTTKLSQEELQALGLQSQVQSVSTVDNQELKKFVGMFVKHANNVGMIRSVHGNRLAFVYADKESWTVQLVYPNNVTRLQGEDATRAKRSAHMFFMREATSLRSRIARHFAFDNAKSLENLLAEVTAWERKLSA